MKKIVFFTAIALYVLACALPAYRLEDGGVHFGASCIFLGLFAIFYNQWALAAWLANHTFFLGILAYRNKWKDKVWRIAQALGVVMSFGAFSVNKFLVNEAGGETKATITYGAFVWIASLVLLLIANLLPDEKR